MLIRLFIDQTTFRITKWFLHLFSSELYSTHEGCDLSKLQKALSFSKGGFIVPQGTWLTAPQSAIATAVL